MYLIYYLPMRIMTVGPVKVCVLAHADVFHFSLVFTFLQVGIVLITCTCPVFKLLLFGVTCGIADIFTE